MGGTFGCVQRPHLFAQRVKLRRNLAAFGVVPAPSQLIPEVELAGNPLDEGLTATKCLRGLAVLLASQMAIAILQRRLGAADLVPSPKHEADAYKDKSAERQR